MESGRIPALTAALVIGARRERVGRCVEMLLAQTAVDEMEIVIADVAPGEPPPPHADDPRVHRLELPPDTPYAVARVAAVRASRGRYIAFLEDHSYPDPGWAAAILEAFRRPVALVNYAFTLANPPTYITRAMLVAEYGRWMAPAKAGPVRIPASNNIAYRRTALEPYEAELESWFEAEFMLHRDILERGGGVWLAPDARLAHECWTALGPACRANGAMKRLLADARVKRAGWGRAKRTWYAAAMALAPGQALWRLGRSMGGRPALWTEFLLSLPVCLAIYGYSAVQEALGYLLGAGGARDEFNAVELAYVREE